MTKILLLGAALMSMIFVKGRLDQPEKNVYVCATDKPTRTIAFIKFNNRHSTPGTEYLKSCEYYKMYTDRCYAARVTGDPNHRPQPNPNHPGSEIRIRNHA